MAKYRGPEEFFEAFKQAEKPATRMVRPAEPKPKAEATAEPTPVARLLAGI